MSEDRERRRGPSPLAGNLVVALLCVIWGSTWVVIKVGLRDLPPFFSAGVRFSIAAVVMAGVAALLAGREGGRRPPVWLALVMGVSQFSVSYGIVYSCSTVLPSGIVSVLWSTYPLMMAVAGHFFLPGEVLQRSHGLGFLVGFAGVAVLYLTDLGALGSSAAAAAALLLLSPLVVALGTTVIKRYGANCSSLQLSRNGMFMGAALLLLAALLTERGEPVTWSTTAVLSVAYLSLVGSVTTFGLYFWLLRYDRATRLSIIAYVTPAVALCLGALVAGESVGGQTIVGSLLILLGVALAGRRTRE